MYSYIKGHIIEKYDNMLILENNGIGYELIVSTNTLALPDDKEVKIYVYMQVKEDGVTLFGFYSQQEKNIFLDLISVNGVGGKTAILILSSATLENLISSISNNDSRFLKSVKGIGKKTAEMICVALNEKMAKLEPSIFASMQNSTQPTISKNVNNQVIEETCEGLISMGMKKADAIKMIKDVYTGTETTEELIMKVLKNRK